VAARRLGRSDEELVGKPVFDFMPPDVAESRKMRILQVVRSRKPARFEDESHGRFFDHNMYPVLDVLGDVAQVAIFVRDVTDYKQAVARLEERTAELLTVVTKLELINQELEEFAFIASHDLQEPLRKIQVYCDLANERCREHLDIEGQKYLDRITGSAGRMRELLNSLLQYSRISLRPEPFKTIDLVRVARQAANLFEMDFKKSGGRIEIESMPELEADESQILSLFENLIGNALKFCSQEGPQIKIYARSEGRRCEIFVSDNGIGFERQFAELIFKPFERLHGPGEYEGTGMGLTICRKIVQRHKGDIRAESEPGKGSTFIISLPLKQNV
jgi:light-regulated signal transduction histidine kinase (bacteriophytochrome)